MAEQQKQFVAEQQIYFVAEQKKQLPGGGGEAPLWWRKETKSMFCGRESGNVMNKTLHL